MSEKQRHIERGEKAFARNRVDNAVEEFQAALRLDPDDQALRRRLIELCLTHGRGSEAARLLAQSFEYEAHSGEPAVAIATYRKLVKLAAPTAEQQAAFARLIEPTNIVEAAEVYAAAAEGFRSRGRREDAWQAAAAVSRLKPLAANFRREAELAAEAGERHAAAQAYLRAAQLLPAEDVDTAVLLAKAYELHPEEPAVAVAFARVLVGLREYARAIGVVEPLTRTPGLDATFQADAEDVYGEALLGAGRMLEAEPYVWRSTERKPERAAVAYQLLESLFAEGHLSAGLSFARRLQAHQARAGQRRTFVARLKGIGERHNPGLPFLEYLAEVFDSYSEHDYSATLIKLFDLHYAAGSFLKAADCLDRAAEVDQYEPGHRQRLEMLRGKVDARHFNVVAHRIGAAPADGTAAEAKPADDGTTVLEDLVLQAEIFLQYGMHSRASERLGRIRKLFPAAEHTNDKLKNLLLQAGMDAPSTGASIVTAAPAPTSVGSEPPSIDNIGRITEITRNIYRQGNVKSVLFTAVNEVGRHWNASRCIAVLAAPGKPPSIALEYVAPGMRQSNVMDVVKMVALMQPLVLAHGPLAVTEEAGPRTAALQKFVAGIGISSLLAVPLVENDTHVGLLVVAQVAEPREWRRAEIDVLGTVAEQVSLAVANARLRSLVKNLAVTEEKSGLLKRSSYLDMLVSEVRRAQAQGSPLTLMLANFGRSTEMLKQFGDPAVETLMSDLGHLIVSHTRQHDLVFRYDKTTIALLLAETIEKNGIAVYEKLRSVISAARLPQSDDPPRLTAGIAEAVMNSAYDPVDIVTEAVNRVESALEGAVREGGECYRALAPTVTNEVTAA